jgi:hypothetical protein
LFGQQRFDDRSSSIEAMSEPKQPQHAETPIDDALADLRGDELTADGRKLEDQPRVGAMTPDVDPDDDAADPPPPDDIDTRPERPLRPR